MYLTDGPVYICQPDSASLVPGAGSDAGRDIFRAASGLPGTHIHHVIPASRQRSVWQIGYQDVAAIGHLLETGRIKAGRILSVGGAGLADSALVCAPLGAKLSDLVHGRGNAGCGTIAARIHPRPGSGWSICGGMICK
ncbi:MAG: hypothetical protein IPF96_20200 [Rhodobacter sp.]|nr:hypothetical protein [Rhodobacter sp.]